jgi:hypothetical protein
MDIEQAVYREETGLWYQIGKEFKTVGVVAYNYPEAFEKLYGHAVVIPPPVRTPRRESILS